LLNFNLLKAGLAALPLGMHFGTFVKQGIQISKTVINGEEMTAKKITHKCSRESRFKILSGFWALVVSGFCGNLKIKNFDQFVKL
jgi:hypothetical protein